MSETIGKVTLNYDYYSGNDCYSDGEIEDYLLEIAKLGKVDEILKKSNEWPVLYHFSDIRENILEWYPIQDSETVLEIGSGCGALSGMLARKAARVIGVELSKKRSMINAYKNKQYSNLEIMVGNLEDMDIGEKFDYVTLIGVLEYAAEYIQSQTPYFDLLQRALGYLKPNGKLIIAIENKMGLKYLNGAGEDHVGEPYAGINDYVGKHQKIRTFSKVELENLLEAVNIKRFKFYYPVPDYKLPLEIYTDAMLPKPGNLRPFGTNYDAPRAYCFNEAIAFDQVCSDGKFDYFSNSFLVVCNTDTYAMEYIKYNRERRAKYRLKTSIQRVEGKRIVKKEALCSEAQGHIVSLVDKGKKIQEQSDQVIVLQGKVEANQFVYPFCGGDTLDTRLFLLRNNLDRFIAEVKEYIRRYYLINENEMKEFEMTGEFKKVFGEIAPEQAKALPYTNIDYLMHNLIFNNNQAYAFDYEWVFDFPIPYKYVIWRSLLQLYGKYKMYLRPQCTAQEFQKVFGFTLDDNHIYLSMEKHFVEYVFDKDAVEIYTKKYRKHAYTQSMKFLY